MAEQSKQGQQQGREKGRDNRPFRMPLLSTLKMGFRYMMTLADEALLAAIFALPFYAIGYAMKVKQVTVPVDFLTLWSIAFLTFLLQNSLFRRGGGGSQ